MINKLNLYKNFNLSLGDIHKKQYPQEKISNASKVKTKPTVSKKKLVISIALLLVMISFLLTTLVKILKPEKQPVVIPVIEPKKIEPIITIPQVQYVILQPLDFEEISSTSDALTSELPENKTDDTIASIKSNEDKIENTHNEKSLNTENKPPLKDHGIVRKDTRKNEEKAHYLYSAEIKGLTVENVESLKLLGLQKGLKIESKAEDPLFLWNVYAVTPEGSITIDNVIVKLEKRFESKDMALEYAYKLNMDTIIKLTDNNDIRYTVFACCSDLETVKNYAAESGITENIFSLKNTGSEAQK